MEIKPFKPDVTAGLTQRGAGLVYLYGSEALGLSNRFSDIDVGIVFRDSSPLKDRRQRVALHSELGHLLEPILNPSGSREMDLVFLQMASPVLRFEAIRAGCALFVADPVFRADYEAEVIRDYLDVRPLVQVHYQAVLERVG